MIFWARTRPPENMWTKLRDAPGASAWPQARFLPSKNTSRIASNPRPRDRRNHRDRKSRTAWPQRVRRNTGKAKAYRGGAEVWQDKGLRKEAANFQIDIFPAPSFNAPAWDPSADGLLWQCATWTRLRHGTSKNLNCRSRRR